MVIANLLPSQPSMESNFAARRIAIFPLGLLVITRGTDGARGFPASGADNHLFCVVAGGWHIR